MWRRRHGTERPPQPPKVPPPVDDGRRELYVVESYGAGWYCRAVGRWWQVPAHRYGWRKRKAATAPAEARLVAGDWRWQWMTWLGIPGVPT